MAKHTLLSFFTLAAIAIAGVPASAGTLSLEEAVNIALQSNPEIRTEQREVDARDREVRQALAGYYPTLDLVAAYGFQERDPVVGRNPFTGELPAGRTRNELDRSEVQLNLRQLVFDGFRTQSEHRNQKARLKSAQHRTYSVAEDVSLRVVQAYIDVLNRQQILDVAKESLAFHEDVYQRMEKRFDSGAGSKADLSQISGRLALAKTNLVTASNNLLDSRINFQRVVGRFPEEGELVTPGSYASALSGSVEEAVSRAVNNHPLLKTAEADVEAVSATYKQTKSAFLPSLHIEAQRDWNDNINGVEGRIDDTQVLLRLRYNIFNGQADVARKQQFAYLVEQAREIRNNARRAVEEELRLAWSSREALAQQLPALKTHMEDSLSTRDSYTQQFDLGRRTLLDLLNTENEYIDARIAYQQAWHQVLFSEYRIFRATGDLLGTLGAQL
ncbi:TolC family outer membrane protein [bacterium SCSIO 12696]|nr:TolC family outer membrane protein [bacterium SCSIO 12696]